MREPAVLGDGVLILFLSDSQGCMFWYLYIPAGALDHAVASSPELYHRSGERTHDEEPNHRALAFSAESFEAFLYRFWIENEIWYSGYEGTPINEEGRPYLDPYRNALPDPLRDLI